MEMARITTKGQVTIPKAVRERLRAKQGDFLAFELGASGEVTVRAVEQKPLSDLYGALASSRAFPGKAAVREQVGRKLGARRR